MGAHNPLQALPWDQGVVDQVYGAVDRLTACDLKFIPIPAVVMPRLGMIAPFEETHRLQTILYACHGSEVPMAIESIARVGGLLVHVQC